MGEGDSKKTFMECSLSYIVTNEVGSVVAEGSAKAQLDDSFLSIFPDLGDPWLFSYSDIVGISEGDYRINLFLSSKGSVTLTELGYKYEDFLINLYRLRGELLLRYLLMEEKLREPGVEASFIYFDDQGEETYRGSCELRLYDTALVVLPQLDPVKARKLSHLIREGRAAKKDELDLISEEFWTQMEKRVKTTDLSEGYEFLKGLSQEKKI